MPLQQDAGGGRASPGGSRGGSLGACPQRCRGPAHPAPGAGRRGGAWRRTGRVGNLPRPSLAEPQRGGGAGVAGRGERPEPPPSPGAPGRRTRSPREGRAAEPLGAGVSERCERPPGERGGGRSATGRGVGPWRAVLGRRGRPAPRKPPQPRAPAPCHRRRPPQRARPQRLRSLRCPAPGRARRERR